MDVEHIECSITRCRSVLHCDCRWGTGNLPVQEATFCKEHADELESDRSTFEDEYGLV
jgi:hypothetical protein